MKNLKRYFLMLQLLLILGNTIAERNFRVVFGDVTCHSTSPIYFSNATCFLLKRFGKDYINIIYKTNNPLDNFKLRWILESVSGKLPKRTLIDLTADGCVVLSKKFKNPFLQTILKKVNKYVKNPMGCPLKANFTYIIKDLVFDENDLPPFTPNVQFRLRWSYIAKGETLIRFMVAGQTINK